jgi:hypothetical protein
MQRAVSAQALYEQATSEMDAGSYASACPKLEEVTRLIPDGIGAKLTLARCYEKVGKLASAWAQYALVAAMAARPGQEERARTAKAKAESLKPRLAHVTVDVPEDVRAVPGLTITCDSAPVGAPQWGLPLPMDVGEHTLIVSAPGRTPWTAPFSIKEDGASISILVKSPLLDRPSAPPPERPQGAAPPPTRPRGAPPLPERPQGAAPPPTRQFQRPLGVAAMALGGAGLVAGGVLGGLAISRWNESNDGHCGLDDRCDDVGLDLRSDAVVFGDASTAAFIAGGVVLAAGVTLFATAPSRSAARARMSLPEGGIVTGLELLPGGIRMKGAW